MITRVLSQIGRGFVMGAADIVPGVSGGTVALLFGIYERLVAEIRQGAGALGSFIRFDLRGGLSKLRQVDWLFLGSLVVGIGLAIVVLISWIRTQIDEHPVVVSAVFFGLVAASIVVARREVARWNLRLVLIGVLTAVAAFVLLGQRSGGFNDPSTLIVVLAGAVAICAMILPGISGSFILLIFGLYDHITEAIDERNVATIAAFGVGAIFGLASFSTVLHWLLRKYHDAVLAVLLGLMAGSLRVLWPWPSGDDGLENVALGQPVSSEVLGALIGAVVAAAVVLAVTEIGVRRVSRL